MDPAAETVMDTSAQRGPRALRRGPRRNAASLRPAAVTGDPSSGTIPTGYLILNVTTGHIKRHAGGYVWEVPGA